MSPLRIGLITEGITDQIVLRKLLEKHLQEISVDRTFEFIDLQPSADRTSGSAEGGWEMVYRWCIRNPPGVRKDLFLSSALFADDLDQTRCDLIIVQMDADVCDKVADKTLVKPVPTEGASHLDLGNFTESVVNAWLWPAPLEPESDHIVAPTVRAIETWLVAGLGEHIDPENLADPSRALVEIDFMSRGLVVPQNARSVRKSRKRYELLASKASLSISKISARCWWFTRLTDQLSDYLSAEVREMNLL